MSARPSELRTCYAASTTSWMLTPCATAHRGEFLAQRPVPGAADGVPESGALLDSCRQVATRLIGVPVGEDPRVRLTLRYQASIREGEVVGGAPGLAGAVPGAGGTVRCAIEATGEHRLTASVIGIAGAPLPVS